MQHLVHFNSFFFSFVRLGSWGSRYFFPCLPPERPRLLCSALRSMSKHTQWRCDHQSQQNSWVARHFPGNVNSQSQKASFVKYHSIVLTRTESNGKVVSNLKVLLSFQNTLHSSPRQIQFFSEEFIKTATTTKIWIEETDGNGRSRFKPDYLFWGKTRTSIQIPSSQSTPLQLGCRSLWCGLLSGWSCSALSL